MQSLRHNELQPSCGSAHLLLRVSLHAGPSRALLTGFKMRR